MISFKHTSLKDFMKNQSPTNPTKEVIENFKAEIELFLQKALIQDDEEFQKNEINKFLAKVYGYDCNTKGKVDSAIYVEGEAQVLIEAKSLKNKTEFPKKDAPLSKALYESILYFLREIQHNNSIKHIILANPHEFYIFDADKFEILFLKDKKIKKFYENCDDKKGTDKSTKKFFEEVEKHLKGEFEGELAYTHFSLKDNLSTEELSLIYQLLSPQVLLKARKTLDANTLNKNFYEELLYILGLQEVSESGKSGGKILIKPSGTPNSLSDAIAKAYDNPDEETIFTLITTWNNRVLFLALLESMLLGFKHINKPFLDYSIIKDFGTLQSLFFDVLAQKIESRSPSLIPEFASIPYLNSSLFDRIALEREGKSIGGLYPSSLQLFSRSILRKDPRFKDRESLPLLEYLFEFLHAYDFTTTPKNISQGMKQNHDKLINSAVLGLVFEKLNGYKEGSFYTPSFITSYMCKESITQAVIEKFNSTFGWKCENLEELREEMGFKGFRENREEYFQTFLSLKICDPSVGSGHFLVSALNEMISIAYTLKLIPSLYESTLELENDEILIKTNNELHQYTKPSSPIQKSHQIQEELFNLKKSLIENCLFGVDINPNSCEITKLRLWIELLKYSYYLFDESGANTNALETLPNIDINIKCGNSLISRFSLDDNLNKIKNIKKKIQEYKELVAHYKDPNPLYPLDKTQLTNKILELKVLFSLTLKDPKTKAELEKAIKTHIEAYNDFALDDESLLEGLSVGAKNLFGTPELSPKEQEEAFASYGKIRALRKKLDSALSGEEYKNAFEWRFEFPEVLDEEGSFLGFDVIIGNPPYLDSEYMKKNMPNERELLKVKYKSTRKNWDIYIPFLELFSKIATKRGYFAFITSDKWLSKPFGLAIRELLYAKMLKFFKSGDVFDSATVDSLVSFGTNIENGESIRFEFENQINIIQKSKIKASGDYSLDYFYTNGQLLNKIMIHPTLTNIANCENACSTSETYKLDPLIDDNNNPQTSFKMINTGTIGKYVSKFGDKPMKYLGNNYLTPFVEKKIFFQHFKNKYAKLTQSKKIIIKGLTLLDCCLDLKGDFIAGKSTLVITTNDDNDNILMFLCAILNSRLAFFFIKQKHTTNDYCGGINFTKDMFNSFPIPQITESNQSTADKIIALVEEILKAKEQDPSSSTQELEKEIDSLVYALYNLTDEEIKIIKGEQ